MSSEFEITFEPMGEQFKTPNGKWIRVKRRWGIYILNFFKRDLFLFVFLSEK